MKGVPESAPQEELEGSEDKGAGESGEESIYPVDTQEGEDETHQET